MQKKPSLLSRALALAAGSEAGEKRAIAELFIGERRAHSLEGEALVELFALDPPEQTVAGTRTIH